MRLYISGPMTGLPDNNRPAFRDAERTLRCRGFKVINPARPALEGWSWQDYMRRAVRDVSRADGVALLPGWRNSRGALVEVALAEGIGLEARMVDFWWRCL